MRRRSPALSFLLSLVLPGLGHLYALQPTLAGAFFAAAALWMIVVLSSPLLLTFHGAVIALFVEVAFRIFAGAHAAVVARRAGDTKPPLYANGYVCVLLLVGWFALWLIHDGYLTRQLVAAQRYSLYWIPSASMKPTLTVNDWLIADREWARKASLNRGDIVIFQPPFAMKMLVKRVVGLSGDVVEARNGMVMVNGNPINLPGASNLAQTTVRDFHAVTVPADEVFVVGDNLPISADSRIFGPIPVSSVKCRVLYLVWPWSRAGMTF